MIFLWLIDRGGIGIGIGIILCTQPSHPSYLENGWEGAMPAKARYAPTLLKLS
jgi:hypothetical protein